MPCARTIFLISVRSHELTTVSRSILNKILEILANFSLQSPADSHGSFLGTVFFQIVDINTFAVGHVYALASQLSDVRENSKEPLKKLELEQINVVIIGSEYRQLMC